MNFENLKNEFYSMDLRNQKTVIKFQIVNLIYEMEESGEVLTLGDLYRAVVNVLCNIMTYKSAIRTVDGFRDFNTKHNAKETLKEIGWNDDKINYAPYLTKAFALIDSNFCEMIQDMYSYITKKLPHTREELNGVELTKQNLLLIDEYFEKTEELYDD